jgi:hypothetical protein
MEHPVADLVDQAGLFGDRNEFHRRDHAALGVAPSQQRLAGGDLLILEIEHGLVEKLETAVGDRLTQLKFQASPGLGARIHAGLEEPIGPPSVAFGTVEREVRVLQQLVEVQPVARGECNSDAGIRGDQMTGTLERRPNRCKNSINELSGFRLFLDGRLNDGKLVATEPGRHVGLLQAIAEALGHALQKFVTDRMTEGIIDALELVDVDIEHRQLFARPDRLQRLFQPLAEQHPVG